MFWEGSDPVKPTSAVKSSLTGKDLFRVQNTVSSFGHTVQERY